MFVFSSAVRRWICSCRRWKAPLRLQPSSRQSPSPGLRSAPSRHWGTKAAPEPRSRRERLRTASPGASGREGRTSRRFSMGLRSALTAVFELHRFRIFVFYKLLADDCLYLLQNTFFVNISRDQFCFLMFKWYVWFMEACFYLRIKNNCCNNYNFPHSCEFISQCIARVTDLLFRGRNKLL